nr:hypothetical protein [uncultured Stomatobaculum sp.]
MKHVIAEKPSLAKVLAKVLGANRPCEGHLSGEGYIVSWCVGYLVALSARRLTVRAMPNGARRHC